MEHSCLSIKVLCRMVSLQGLVMSYEKTFFYFSFCTKGILGFNEEYIAWDFSTFQKTEPLEYNSSFLQ